MYSQAFGTCSTVYMCAVLQTEQEKQLRKMFQREEKKLTRRKDGDIDVVDHGKVGFNPQELRSQRYLVQIVSYIVIVVSYGNHTMFVFLLL